MGKGRGSTHEKGSKRTCCAEIVTHLSRRNARVDVVDKDRWRVLFPDIGAIGYRVCASLGSERKGNKVENEASPFHSHGSKRQSVPKTQHAGEKNGVGRRVKPQISQPRGS